MPTSPVVATVSGASFSINTTAANLDPILTIRDFLVLENGTLTVNPLSYTKVTATSVTYSGPSLAANTSIELRRSTPRDQRTVVLPNTKVRSVDWNLEFDRRVRIQEEVDLYGAGGGFTVRLPVNGAYGVSWQSDTLFSPTRQALYNQMQLYAPLASPVFTGNPTVPTPITADNSTSIASTAYVKSNLGQLAPLASPAFTGNPTVPTPLTTDNTTTVANTVYVKNNLASYLPLAGGNVTGTLNVLTVGTSDNSTQAASTAHVKNNLASYVPLTSLSSYAPLASPPLTGTPTTPSFANGVKTSQVANALTVQKRSQPVVIARRTAALNTVSGSFIDIAFNDVIRDSMGVYSGASGVFTAPYTGIYSFTGNVTVSSTSTLVLSLVNTTGTELVRVCHAFLNTAGVLGTQGTVFEFLNAGDTRKFNVFTNTTTTIIPDTTARLFCHINISYLGIDTAS
jgi:hypothetical protein